MTLITRISTDKAKQVTTEKAISICGEGFISVNQRDLRHQR